jgi:hypothetical protein
LDAQFTIAALRQSQTPAYPARTLETIKNDEVGKVVSLIASITDVLMHGRLELDSGAVLHPGAFPAWQYGDNAQLVSLRNGTRIIASYATLTTNAIGRLTFFTTIRSTLQVLFFGAIACADFGGVLDRHLSHQKRTWRRHWRELAARYIFRNGRSVYRVGFEIRRLACEARGFIETGEQYHCRASASWS